MLVSEDYLQVEDGKQYRLGESGLYEPFTDDIGTLFRAFQREYGRCMSKVYIDTTEGAKQVGWVFQKRMQYSDSKNTYLAETWITLHQDKPKKSVEYNYHFL